MVREGLVAIVLSTIMGLVGASGEKLKARIIDYADPSTLRTIATSTDPFERVSICENWIAYSNGGNIFYQNRDNGIVNQLTNSGMAYQPNLDSVNGNLLVYQEDGSVYLHDLNTSETKTVYQRRGNEFCSFPKINGDNLVYKLYLPWGEGALEVINRYSISEDAHYPISRSLNRKGEPDIFGRYVIWPEEQDSIVNDEVKKFDHKLYDLELGKEMTLTSNFVTGDISSCAIYNDTIVGVANYIGWDTGPCSAVVHKIEFDFSKQQHKINMGIVSFGDGKKGEVALYENIMVCTKDRFGNRSLIGWDINGRDLDRFEIPTQGNPYNPDVYVDLDGTINVIYIANGVPVVTKDGFSSSKTKTNKLENKLMQIEIIPYSGPSQCGDRGTVYLPGDINQDCYVGIDDFAIIGINWLLRGMENQYPREGDYENNPENMITYCELAPEFNLEGRMIQWDPDGDCEIGLGDLKIFTENWMTCSDPANSNCDAYWEYTSK